MKKLLLLITLVSVFQFQQSIAQPPPSGSAPIMINEVDYDQISADNAEFIELKSNVQVDLPLGDWKILLYNGNPNALEVYDTLSFPQVNLSAGDYYVICGNGGNVPNCDLVIPSLSNIIENGGSSLSSPEPDAIALYNVTTDTIYDVLSYEGSCPLPFLEGTGLDASLADNNNDTLLGISRIPDGTDTDDNSVDFRRRCITPGLPNGVDSIPCMSIPTGVSNISKDVIDFFPNPASNRLHIFVEDFEALRAEIRIHDMTGRLIRQNKIAMNNGLGVLSVAGLSEGIYIIQFESQSLNVIRKIKVQK